MNTRTKLLKLSRRVHSGQALVELAAGLFTLALIMSALCVFVEYIAKSLDMENHIRSGDRATIQAKIPVDDFANEHVFGSNELHIKEPRGSTDREIPKTLLKWD